MTSLLPEFPTEPRYRALGVRQLDEIATRFGMSEELKDATHLMSQVLPFRVNDYVLSHLIEWDNAPDDPMFRLLFPQRGMLSAPDEAQLAALTSTPSSKLQLKAAVQYIRLRMNPHPSGQMSHNVPRFDGADLAGLQHKYRETVLYFPGQGQTCHAYCSYCFRWAQFVGEADLKFSAPDPGQLISYLHAHPEVHDVLVTGGDPLIMSTERLRSHLEPLLSVESVRTIRLGTKSVAYWPHRFVSDPDADDLLRLMEQIVASGRQCAVMAHFSHPRELEPEIARQAVRRIRGTGAVVYCQAPLIARVNDRAEDWVELWTTEHALGAVPYYMFVEWDTGPHDYFKVPLDRAVDIFQRAYRALPGLARTVRGPVMSTTAGKIAVDGIGDAGDGPMFQLRMLQARDPGLVGRPFRAHHSTTASWIDELVLHSSAPADIADAVDPAARPLARAAAGGA